MEHRDGYLAIERRATVGSELDLREFLRILRRRKSVLFGVFALVVVLTGLVLMQIGTQYRATASVIVENRKARMADLREVLPDLPLRRDEIENEIEVIRSRSLAEVVIRREGLETLPEFNPALRPKGVRSALLSRLRALLDEPWIVELRYGAAGRPPAEESGPDGGLNRVVDVFLSRLDVRPTTASRVLSIRFSSRDPKLAARIANAVAEVYTGRFVELKVAAAERAALWLSEQVGAMREKVALSEQAVEAFRQRSGLLRTDQGTLVSDEIAELNRRLAAAGVERAQAIANQRELRALMKEGGIDAAQPVLASPLIQQLRYQESAVLREMAELAVDHGAQHPKMIYKRVELQELRDKIKEETDKVIRAYDNAVSSATAREASLKAELEKFKTRLGKANTQEVELRALEREAEADRHLLESFLARLKETTPQLDADMQSEEARVLSRAVVPSRAHPPRVIVFAVAAISSAGLGVALALVLERLDRGFRNGHQIEQAIGIPVLALLPLCRNGDVGGDFVPEQGGTSQFAEGVRTAYSRLVLRSGRSTVRSILVTSSLPEEGKTTFALSLAGLRSLSGHRVVVVEADLRRPAIHRRWGLPPEPGLTDLLLGRAELERVLGRNAQSGAYVIPAGAGAADPADLLSSERMKAVLEQLVASFDLVVLDSPPVMSVADACGLASMVEETLFVVRWGRTDRDAVDVAVRKVAEARGGPTGIVLSMVDAAKIGLYGYGDAAYYSRANRKYYTGGF
jgi:capsular exopolysaccharide synthesis family protein